MKAKESTLFLFNSRYRFFWSIHLLQQEIGWRGLSIGAIHTAYIPLGCIILAPTLGSPVQSPVTMVALHMICLVAELMTKVEYIL